VAGFGSGLARLLPRTAEGLLAAALFFCPLALGTFQAWSVGVMLSLACLALLALAVGRRDAPLTVPAMGIGLVLLAGYVAAQCLPLPDWLLGVLSPQGAATYAFSLEGLPEAARWHPLTLDVPATAREVAKALAYACAFIGAYDIAASRRASRRLAAVLALAGLTLALIGYGHLLFNVDHLFGQPIFADATLPFVTTFGNRNHAGGFLSLCAPVALGLALRSRDRRRQALWALAYVLTGAAVFLTSSRGAICAFLVAQCALAALLWVLRERPEGSHAKPPRVSPRTAVAAICAAALVVAVAGYLAYQPVADRLASVSSIEKVEEDGKIVGFGQALPLLRDFPLTGIGRGAFATVGARYLTFSVQTAEYIENEALQALADLGLPVGAACLLLLLFTFGRAILRKDLGPLDCGLAAGLLAVGLQNLVDFSFELGGVALPALVALALLCRPGRTDEDDEAKEEKGAGFRWPRWATAGLATASLAIGLAALPASARNWRRETDAFARESAQLPAAEAEARGAAILARHPASFVVPLALADRFVAARQPAHALHWLNRAMYFKPNLAEPHLAAAQALAQMGREDQALLEGRLFFEKSEGSVAGLAALAPRYPKLEQLLSAVPESGAGRLSLSYFLQGRGRTEDAAAAARAGLEAAPGDAALHRQLASLLLAEHEPLDAEIEALQSLKLAPTAPESYLTLAAVLGAKGDAKSAQTALQEGLRRQPGQRDLVLALVRLDLGLGQPDAAEAAIKLMAPSATSARRAELLSVQGDIYSSEGRLVKAEDAYQAAARLQPGGGYEWPLAALLEKQSRFGAAVQLLQRLEGAASGDGKAQLATRIAEDQRRGKELDELEHHALLAAPAAPSATGADDP
jgi:predicted Zn-dependent protease